VMMGDQTTGGQEGVALRVGYFFKILPSKMVHTGVRSYSFAVNWLEVERLNIEVGGLTSEVGTQPPFPAHPLLLLYFNFLTLISSSAGALELDSMLWRLRSQRVIIIIIINHCSWVRFLYSVQSSDVRR